jgi:hypothetical protein
MKTPFILTCSLAAGLLSAQADTYKLKNGRSFEAEIAMETEDSYILLIEIQKGVRDEITVKKSDVHSITKEDMSHDAFKKIQQLLPTSDLLTEKDYQTLISENLTPFLEKHPASEHIAMVKDLEVALLDELAKVRAGELKINGKWLTAEGHAANKYEIEAVLALNPVLLHAKKREFGAALIALAAQEKAYQNTKPYHDALNMCLRLLPYYKSNAQKIVDNAEELIKKRDLSLTRLSSSDKTRITRILAVEEAQYQAQLVKAKKSGGKWLPLNRFHPKSAETVIKSIESESSRLQKIASEGFIDGGAIYREFLESIDKNDLDSAKDQLREFTRSRPPKEYSSNLRDQLSAAVTQMKLIEKQKKAEAEEEERKAKEDAKKKA